MAKRKREDAYGIGVIVETEAPLRGSTPEDIDLLIQKPSKDITALVYLAAKAEVERCIQAGDTAAAWAAIEKYKKEEFKFLCPTNIIKKDSQNGNYPFFGGHCFLGGVKDGADFLFNPFYKKKGDKKPSKKHFRKFVNVRPIHIFMYRPNMDGKVVKKVDGTAGQQPTPEVRGFAKFEYVENPVQMKFTVNVNPRGPFLNLLSEPDNVMAMIKQGALAGVGGGRAVGYGGLKVISMDVI